MCVRVGVQPLNELLFDVLLRLSAKCRCHRSAQHIPAVKCGESCSDHANIVTVRGSDREPLCWSLSRVLLPPWMRLLHFCFCLSPCLHGKLREQRKHRPPTPSQSPPSPHPALVLSPRPIARPSHRQHPRRWLPLSVSGEGRTSLRTCPRAGGRVLVSSSPLLSSYPSIPPSSSSLPPLAVIFLLFPPQLVEAKD